MVATKDKLEAVERIGKSDFTIRLSDSSSDCTSRQERIDALANWLFAQWRLEHGEANN
jgi:hypothetical protein